MARFSKILILFYAIGIIFTGSIVSAQTDAAKKVLTTITKADIEELIKLSDNCLMERNFDLWGTLFADDAKITFKNMPTPEGPRKTETNKADYLSITKFGMLGYEKQELTHKDLEIKIDEGGKKATIKNIVSERATVRGKVIEASAKESIVCELRDGRLLMVLIEGEYLEPDKLWDQFKQR